MQPETQTPAVPTAAIQSIEAIARMEEEFLQHRTLWNRIADTIADFTGSMTFVILHLLAFIAWFLINGRVLSFVPAFDPYPFVLLAMAVSCEAVLLSTFVLMKQNRMSARSERRDHLHLQIALLTEKELTKVLYAVQRMSESQGLTEIAQDSEVRELSENTAVDSLARELQRKLPGDTE